MTGPVASLNTAWFALIGLLWTGYFVLEGFDFGVGMLSLAIGRDDVDRRLARNAIGPVWDGNEVWLIVAAGATFAAFPVWYASMFSGFYLALFIVLAALIVRGVSFEFRGKRDSARWRAGWDWALAVGSLVPAFAWGVAFTDLVHGLRLSPAGLYLGSFSGLLTPVAVVGGLASLAMFLVHGATFLSLKTAGPLAARARRVAMWLAAGRRAGGRHSDLAVRRWLPCPGGLPGTVPSPWPSCARWPSPGPGCWSGPPGWSRVRAVRAGHRGRHRCRVRRVVSAGNGLHRPGSGADDLERRLGTSDPAGDDRRGGDLRSVGAGLPGLELLGVPAAAGQARGAARLSSATAGPAASAAAPGTSPRPACTVPAGRARLMPSRPSGPGEGERLAVAEVVRLVAPARGWMAGAVAVGLARPCCWSCRPGSSPGCWPARSTARSPAGRQPWTACGSPRWPPARDRPAGPGKPVPRPPHGVRRPRGGER